MDSYEVERIAEQAAERAASDVRRDLEYKIDDLQREVDHLNRALDQERHDRRQADAVLDSALLSVQA